MGRKRSKKGERRGAREMIVRPLREGASRLSAAAQAGARKLLERLVELSRGRGRAPLARWEAPSGGLESLHNTLESLEKHAAAFDLPVDFSGLRARLEALLSILLEIEDDRLAGEAACPLAAELSEALGRAQEVFILPEVLSRRLDLSRGALARVRSAFESKDHDLARRELLEHLCQKPIPEGLAAWLLRYPDRAEGEAGLVMRGFFRLREGPEDRPAVERRGRNVWRFLGRPVCWDEVGSGDPHEHAETATLARAYASSGDESYAAEAVGRLLGWGACLAPPPRAGEPSPATPAWGPHRAAGRLVNWGTCLLALRRSRTFTPEAARVLLALVHESAEFLRCVCRQARARPEACASARAGAGLAVAGALFDEFTAAREWAEEGARILAGAAGRVVLPDGAESSLSLPEHERTLDAFLTGGLAASEDSPARSAARAMIEFESAVLLPDGRLPGEPDPDPAAAKDRRAALGLGASLVGMEGGRSSRVAGGAEAHAFEKSGFFVMRTGRHREADYLLLRTTGRPEFRVACAGAEALSGRASPRAVQRKGERPAAGAEGDGLRRVGSPREGCPAWPRSVVFRAGPPCDYVRVVSGLAHGEPEGRGASNRREVVFVERRYWVMADRVSSEENARWSLEFALASPLVSSSPEGRRFIVGDAKGGLLVVLAGPTDTGFTFEGAASPMPLGFQAAPCETDGGAPPRHSTVPGGAASDELRSRAVLREESEDPASLPTLARVEAAGTDVRFVTLLYPLRDEDTDSIAVEPVATEGGRAIGLWLRRPGAEDLVGFPHGEEGDFGALPSLVEAAALSRPTGAAAAGSSWRTLFEVS